MIHPPMFEKQASSLDRFLPEYLSPQVARLANWLISYVLVQEKDFDRCLPRQTRLLLWRPMTRGCSLA